MIFGREREAVRNATRAIRDLVLRPGREGTGGLGSGLGAVGSVLTGLGGILSGFGPKK